MLRCTLLLLLISTLGWGKIVVYEGKGDNCDTLLYTEVANFTVGANPEFDLTALDVTATCSNTSNAPIMMLSYGDVSDTMKDLKISFSFSSTNTGYWNSKTVAVSYNDSVNEVSMTAGFTSASMVSTSFSFACSITSITTLTSVTPAVTAKLLLQNYQLQVYNVEKSKFAESMQCVNWISKGAWMGVFAAVVMIVVLVLSVMMLLGTATPDRFETSKSKCLIIPHEH
ncbi:uncharacterized protein LOC134816017 [Bolinopsis microptera]|uniref:uncharacterized protein LOC134816017 n=1 Tax=Bolinopsis microptera TaxID=2820187 RepID=UPI00307904DC